MQFTADSAAVEPPVAEAAVRQPALVAEILPVLSRTEAPLAFGPTSDIQTSTPPQSGKPARTRWWQWPFVALGQFWNVASLMVLLAVVAAVPLVQLASLGYLLRASANLSNGRAWRTALPGLKLAGQLSTYALWSALLWLPVWLVTDLSYSVQLLRPGTAQAANWRAAAFLVALAWVTWTVWAAMRGGRWWHMLWPAPWGFMTRSWRRATWSHAADQLWTLFQSTQFVSLWWLGARAAVGALIWLVIPASLMIIGLRAQELKPAALVGLIGAFSLTWVMLYLPFLQILVAEKNRFVEIFNVREVRRRFRHAPWALATSLCLLLALCIPLYLLRIEATPEQLTWVPSLVFVSLMFPAKLMLGAALGYAARRTRTRHWVLRWSARLVCCTAALAYVGALYIAQFVAWQGVYVMYFQHAVLVPVAS